MWPCDLDKLFPSASVSHLWVGSLTKLNHRHPNKDHEQWHLISKVKTGECPLQQDVNSTSMILLALSPVLLTQCNCAPQGTSGKVWRWIQLSQLGGERGNVMDIYWVEVRTLLNTLRCTGLTPTANVYLAPKVNALVEKPCLTANHGYLSLAHNRAFTTHLETYRLPDLHS